MRPRVRQPLSPPRPDRRLRPRLTTGPWPTRSACAAACALLVACGGGKVVQGDVAVVGATVIDGTDAAPAPDRTIVIAGDSIVAIGPSAQLEPRVKTTIDGRGKFVIPGLWDMHVHLVGWGEAAFPLFIANGVTTIREMGWGLDSSLALRERSRRPEVVGPTMLVSGPVLDDDYVVRAVAGTPMAGGRYAVGDSASGAAMVDRLADAGVDHIKVHAMTLPAAYRGIMQRARERGLAVVGHVPDAITIEDAIAAGQRTIEHDSQLELAETPQGRAIHDWMFEHQMPIRAANRAKPVIGPVFAYRLAAADSAMATFDSATARAFAQRVAGLPVWFDPTFVVFEVVFRGAEPGLLDRSVLKYAPSAARDFNDGGVPDHPPSDAELALGRKRWENALASLRPLVMAGAKIVTGTDVPESPLVPGFSLHRELQHLVAAGMTPRQAIQAASHNAADAAGRLSRSGTIERGKVADLVLLDADPTAHIENTTTIRAVVTRGRVLDRAALDSLLRAAEAYAKTH